MEANHWEPLVVRVNIGQDRRVSMKNRVAAVCLRGCRVSATEPEFIHNDLDYIYVAVRRNMYYHEKQTTFLAERLLLYKNYASYFTSNKCC